MIEFFGDMWSMPADLHVITTNGNINRQGRAVMGRGVAAQAKSMFVGVDRRLAELLQASGNHVHYLGLWLTRDATTGYRLLSFPVKRCWYEDADLDLIRQSVEELRSYVKQRYGSLRDLRVVLPRPGCGNGRLRWEDVRPIVSDLDDRFVVVTKEEER